MPRYKLVNKLLLLKSKKPMRSILVVLLTFLFFNACDDGDIITVNLEFEDDLSLCENDVDNYTVYKVRTDPEESLSLVFPRNAENDLLFNPEVSPYEVKFGINNTSVFFNYRTYNQTPEFCNTIINSDIIIREDYAAQTSTTDNVTVTATFVDSDSDGISNEDEDDNLDGDSNYLTNPLDTDGDGLPNYIDDDDDNDNVLTIDEDDNLDGDNNPFTNPKDTDNDGIFNYLEEDDDGDGVLSRLEDENENRNPADDFLNDDDNLPRYLNPDASQEFPAPSPEFRVVTYTRTVTTTFLIENLGLDIIFSDLLDYGTYTQTETFSYDNN